MLAIALYTPLVNSSSAALRVASKTFPESYILAEITSQLLESHGFKVERKTGLGGTLIAYEALQNGSIDIYPEYTGTLSQAVLRQPNMTRAQLSSALASRNLNLEVLLGFNNSYAIAISREIAQGRNIELISDLAQHPDLVFGFSLEFLNRGDGWPVLKSAYQLPQHASGIEHALAYRAIESGKLDVTDAYTTDGELDAYDLRLLEDDRSFFPGYEAVLLTRNDLPEAAAVVLHSLHDSIDEPTMRSLNRRLADENLEPREVASQFLRTSGLVDGPATVAFTGTAQRIANYTLVHLKLTLSALFLACLVAIPLALSLARYSGISRSLLYVTGLIQTVPALALLALLIPLVGLGEAPAIIALFLYSLLPIVRNTLTGIFNVDPLLKEVAAGMGLTPAQQLWKVEVPLAVPTILAGVKTAAIISIGTATLAAFVGAGGLGEPIITGLTLNDHRLILEGAIPAALLAIVVELLFEGIERASIPAHLRV
ncbi:MAG: glycine betaine ABC transporter substrate-binding protein [Halioglobus sp.]